MGLQDIGQVEVLVLINASSLGPRYFEAAGSLISYYIPSQHRHVLFSIAKAHSDRT